MMKQLSSVNLIFLRQNQWRAPEAQCYQNSRGQNCLALLFWSFEDGKVFSFGIGVDKSCKLGPTIDLFRACKCNLGIHSNYK